MTRRILLFSLCCAVSAVAEPTAKTEKPRRIDGVVWHPTLASAGEAARAKSRRPARPVVWLRMLGDLAGKT